MVNLIIASGIWPFSRPIGFKGDRRRTNHLPPIPDWSLPCSVSEVPAQWLLTTRIRSLIGYIFFLLLCLPYSGNTCCFLFFHGVFSIWTGLAHPALVTDSKFLPSDELNLNASREGSLVINMQSISRIFFFFSSWPIFDLDIDFSNFSPLFRIKIIFDYDWNVSVNRFCLT